MVSGLIVALGWTNPGRPVRSGNAVVVPKTATVHMVPWRSSAEAMEWAERIWSNAADYLRAVADFEIPGIVDDRRPPDDDAEACDQCGHGRDAHSLITRECPTEE